MTNNIVIIPSKINKVNIVDLSGNVSQKNEHFSFGLISSNKNYKTENVYKIIEPSNDQAFKILFNGINKINKVTGFERAKSLIMSLIGKFPNNKEIKCISYLPNELPEVSGKNRRKLKVLDCPLICEMNDNSKYIIDLEMQNYYYEGIDLNSLTYATSLRNAYNLPVIIILLLIKGYGRYNDSFEIIPQKKKLNESAYKEIDDYVYVICFDLCYILDCINEAKEPELNGFKLTSEGKEWIKLLTIKDWLRKYSSNERYALPKNLSNSKEIISAIMILNSLDNSYLVKNIIKEEENQIIKNNIQDGYSIEIWINAFLNMEVLNSAIVPFPIVAPEFLIRKCNEKNLNKIQCEQFLKWLINNNIIERKVIYEKIINNIYL